MKLAIIINNSSMQPIYEQILDQIKARILHGELQENDTLPLSRKRLENQRANR